MDDRRLNELPRIISQDVDDVFTVEGQCDACPGGALALHTPVPAVHRYVLNASLALELDADHVATGSPAIRGGVIVLNRSAWALARHFVNPRPVEDLSPALHHAVLHMADLGLLGPEHCPAPISSEFRQALPAWLQLTNACQLACDYCYRSRSEGEMSLETARRGIDAIIRSAQAHDYPAIKLKYTGGEPTLRFHLLTAIHRYAAEQTARHRLALDGVVITNGVDLTTQMIETLRSHQLRLAISLDGLGTAHDRQRHFADGCGSFERVARSIERALSGGLVPDISVTITGHNAGHLPELVEWLMARSLPFSLNFYRPTDATTEIDFCSDRIVSGVLAAYRIIAANPPRHSLLASLADRANLAAPHRRPCAAGRGYLVLDHQGRVAKCQMDIAHTVCDVSHPDPLTVVRSSPIGLSNPPVEAKSECNDCRWRYWCAGGCPLIAYRATGRYDTRSPNCAIYRALFPEIVRLEGLRLLGFAAATTGDESPLQRQDSTPL